MKILNKMVNFLALLLIILIQFVYISPLPTYAATSPSLGTAAEYSILAGTSVTNTGATTISKNVGISPGAGGTPNYTGFGTVTLGGSIQDANGAALTAMADRTTAYTALASQGCDTDYGGVTTDLAGKNLVPGVYCSTSFHLTGTLTLNGSAADVWIFKSASDLIMTGGTAVKVITTGGGLPCNVWWRVVSTATFDANSSLIGNILADTSITFAAGASLNGRALARTAEVTLSSNSITGPSCGVTTSSGSSVPAGNNSTTNPPNVCVATAITTVPIIIESRRVSSTSIFISWGPYAGINTFNIRYGPTNGNWLYSTNVTGFSTNLNSLPANQPIWVQVAAADSCSIGTYGEAKLVGGPGLPNTGLAPYENNVPWSILAGILIGASVLPVLIKRKQFFSKS